MTRTFIEVPLFSKRWKEIGLGEDEVIYLITVFEKKNQENLTSEEKNVLKKLVKTLKEETAKTRR